MLDLKIGTEDISVSYRRKQTRVKCVTISSVCKLTVPTVVTDLFINLERNL